MSGYVQVADAVLRAPKVRCGGSTLACHSRPDERPLPALRGHSAGSGAESALHPSALLEAPIGVSAHRGRTALGVMLLF
jgi:hypothetical protein